MDSDKQRELKMRRLLVQEAELQRQRREAESAQVYEKLLVDLLVLRLRINALCDLDEERTSEPASG